MNPKDEQMTEEQRAGREDFLRKELENVLLDPRSTSIPTAPHATRMVEEKRHTVADLMSVTDDDQREEKVALQSDQAKNLRDKLQDISISYAEPRQATQTIRTFKSDVEGAVKSGKANLISITAAELTRQSEASREGDLTEQSSGGGNSRNVLITALFITLLLIAGGLISLYLAQRAKDPTPHTSTTTATNTGGSGTSQPLFSITPQERLGVTYDTRSLDLKANILLAISQSSGKFGSITELMILNNSASTTNVAFSKLSRTLELRMPDSLARTIGEDYFFGVHHYGGNFPFLITTVDAFETATPAMLEWERTMVEDLGYVLRNKGDFSSAAKDPTTQKYFFKDVVIQNHDARAILNNDSKVIFYYTFFDKNTLIFGTNQDTISLVETALSGRTVSQ